MMDSDGPSLMTLFDSFGAYAGHGWEFEQLVDISFGLHMHTIPPVGEKQDSVEGGRGGEKDRGVYMSVDNQGESERGGRSERTRDVEPIFYPHYQHYASPFRLSLLKYFSSLLALVWPQRTVHISKDNIFLCTESTRTGGSLFHLICRIHTLILLGGPLHGWTHT